MTAAPDRHARAQLPIPDRPVPGLTTYDAKDPDTAYPPIEPLHPPEGAPNVLIVLLDDGGFGASSAFGGPCRTPVAERLAAGGLRYLKLNGYSTAQFGKCHEVPVWQSSPMGPFSADEAIGIGYESGTAVSADYRGGDSRFTGKIVWVRVDLGDDDHGHGVDPEERLRVAMARQ